MQQRPLREAVVSRVLVCGANGFIGGRVVTQLLQAGHAVTCAATRRPGRPGRTREDLPFIRVDFSTDVDPAAWLPRVQGFDTVINAVGVLRNSARRPMQAVHHRAPAALFAACAQAGVRRIVHVSALGIGRDDRDNATLYAQTKRAAEDALAALPAAHAGGPSWIALRPSVVLGAGGDATAMFRGLALLPVLAMPRPALDAQVQPVDVDDLAQAIAVLADPASPHQGIVEFGGARALSLSQLIATLRDGRRPGIRAARVVPLPAWTGVLSARAGDFVPFAPWCSDTRAMLEQDSVAPSAPLAAWLGREPRDVRDIAI